MRHVGLKVSSNNKMDLFMEVDNIVCAVCGEHRFKELEGFYYCIECGTQKEQLRAVEVGAEDNNDTTVKNKHVSTRRLKSNPATEENEITSWEFYNYVLHGFLDELLNMGAKPDLKLMTLQIWAAYLGRMEVAFCKNNEMGLPKLNVRALPRDARVIYNHRASKRKRERLIQREAPPHNERASRREWRKTKRKLDESGYTTTGSVSASTTHTTQSLKLQWSQNARKSLKKFLPLKHLEKHSADNVGLLHCHSLRPKAARLNLFDRNIYCLNITKLYTVLALALNMVGDHIQLIDLLRLIDEEHLTSRYVLGYLPENVAAQGKALLSELEWSHQDDKVRYNYFRTNISQLSRFIGMSGYQVPDLEALAQRYVLELNLPPALAIYVIDLINMLPPRFINARWPHVYPQYEARVMAYIIYALKLLFGLDDVKERAISESAAEINKQLCQLNATDTKTPSLLFVFTEWMEFVELRKALVSHYNESFARRFGIAMNQSRKVDDYLKKERKQREQEYNFNEMLLTPAMQRKRENLCLIFETMLKQHFGESTSNGPLKDHIEFQPSLTPAHSYFKRLLLHAAQAKDNALGVNIPPYMLVDHLERDLDPFKKQTAKVEQYLNKFDCHLLVQELDSHSKRQVIGLFQRVERQRPMHGQLQANCIIKTQTWLDDLQRKRKHSDLKFRLPNSNYGSQYQKKLLERAQRRQMRESANPFWDIKASPKFLMQLRQERVPLNDLHSIQIFNESNMEPLRVPLAHPRRYLSQQSSIQVTPQKEPKHKDNAPSEQPQVERQSEQELTLKISNFDCWLLHGCVGKLSYNNMRELTTMFPCSFRWLLDTCAATIGVNQNILYEQLLVIEVMFHHGIENLSSHDDHLRLKYNCMNKDINMLIKTYRDKW
ncbi:TATA box-binding protein-associated factor RNA polymerase I subunit B isoform X2 [Scaptodrosophila lebanonensis]|uniref:TATA box-binding protein-associated factor RNA polymerase I subunit B n=1 Tax=Drosophila lebanonensis TaxID=7225 RepID=A0A6J2TZ57_DROLE|nr:TATA box-binding protein-associated factor RNA polymerase I subunit B isoform X2 [Scaptodrosophila lebanonensis]